MTILKKIIKKNTILYSNILWLLEIKAIYENEKNYITLRKLLNKKKLKVSKFNIDENIILRQANAFTKILKLSTLEIHYNTNFIGIPNSYYKYIYCKCDECNFINWGNMTPDYNLFIENGIEYFINLSKGKNSDYFKALNITYNAINEFAKKNLKLLKRNKNKYKDINFYISHEHFLSNVINSGASSFLEALQMLFFVHQLCWMEGHTLIGLGNMDQYLYDYYIEDINSGILDEKDARRYLKDFYCQLSNETAFYSTLMYGDTGQVVVVGGEKINILTNLIIEVFRELKIVSPKIILKINISASKDGV